MHICNAKNEEHVVVYIYVGGIPDVSPISFNQMSLSVPPFHILHFLTFALLTFLCNLYPLFLTGNILVHQRSQISQFVHNSINPSKTSLAVLKM